MPETQTMPTQAPPCPVCMGETAIKQVHREPVRAGLVFVYKCRACAVEYPVVANAPSK